MKTYEIKITSEDCAKLKKLHYLDNALSSLLTRLASRSDFEDNAIASAKYFDQYVQNFAEYEDFKDACTAKYMPAEANPAQTTWNADFDRGVLVFTENA